VNFDALVEAGMVDRRDLELFRFADDAETAWSTLLDMGLKAIGAPPREQLREAQQER
jgi:hypothetical protein